MRDAEEIFVVEEADTKGGPGLDSHSMRDWDVLGLDIESEMSEMMERRMTTHTDPITLRGKCLEIRAQDGRCSRFSFLIHLPCPHPPSWGH